MTTSSCPLFKDDIPTSIRNEIKYVVDRTRETNREQSLTFCMLENKDNVFVSDYSQGALNYTDVMPCNKAYGKSNKIGDLHTHPTQAKDTMGITPSVADLGATVLESYELKIPQVSCITGPDAKFIHCFQVKQDVLKDKEKLRKYRKALEYDQHGFNDVHPYIRESVADDFYHMWYNRKTYEHVEPSASEIVKDAFIKAKNMLKFKTIHDLDKGPACDLIEDLNYPHHPKVAEECRKVLHVKNFMGLFRY